MRTLKLFPLVFLLSAASHLNEPIRTNNEKPHLFDLQGDYCQLVDFPYSNETSTLQIKKKKIFVFFNKRIENTNRKLKIRTVSNLTIGTKEKYINDNIIDKPLLQMEDKETKAHYTAAVSLDKIDWAIYEAIQAYKGPTIKITSAFRNHGWKHSLHRKGKALDIHWSPNAVSYFLSEEGQAWLQKYKLQFFIESPSSQDLNDDFDKHFRIVSWASKGLHIHLELID
jgi:hypothetical protein